MEYAAIFGIRKIRSGESRFNIRNVGVLMLLGLDFISVAAHIWFDANTFLDYALSIFCCLAFLSVWFGFIVMSLNSQELFRIQRDTDQLLKKCEI